MEWTERRRDRVDVFTELPTGEDDDIKLCEGGPYVGSCRKRAIQARTTTIDGNIPDHPERNNGVYTYCFCKDHAYKPK